MNDYTLLTTRDLVAGVNLAREEMRRAGVRCSEVDPRELTTTQLAAEIQEAERAGFVQLSSAGREYLSVAAAHTSKSPHARGHTTTQQDGDFNAMSRQHFARRRGEASTPAAAKVGFNTADYAESIYEKRRSSKAQGGTPQ